MAGDEVFWRDLKPSDLTPHEWEALLEAARLAEDAAKHVNDRLDRDQE